MYAIRVNSRDKSLTTTVRGTIYSGEKNADTLIIFVPTEYDAINIADCELRLCYTLPSGSELHDKLTREDELYKNYYQYHLSIGSSFTDTPGRIEARITATNTHNEIVLKSGVTYIDILPSKSEEADEGDSPGNDDVIYFHGEGVIYF